jgi:hypothetical protein
LTFLSIEIQESSSISFMKFLLLVFFFSLPALSCSSDGQEGLVPKNNLSYKALPGATGITSGQFHRVIDHIEKIYAPVFVAMTPKLSIQRNWFSDTVNAFATLSYTFRTIDLHGGMARHPLMTEDAFALVVCHEVGHHLGGFPAQKILSSSVLSNEGQADYFSTLKCLRRYFLRDSNQKIISNALIPESLRKNCEESFKDKEEVAICLRSALAGLDFAKFSASLRGTEVPKFDTPEKRTSLMTDHDYPSPQCRLDTFVMGAICPISYQEDISETDETSGVCHELNNHSKGMRPSCWFAPSL